MNGLKSITTVTLFLSLNLIFSTSEAQQRGITGKVAPRWGVTKWLNLPDGQRNLDIDDYNGKVIYLYCFQSWCPGCHSHGLPTLQKMIKKYEGNSEVAFVAIQTVFEGFGSNTFEAAKKVGKQYSLSIPIGQSGENGNRSTLMGKYRTGGTPWTIIIDKDGTVRYNDFHAEVESASRLIDQLLAVSEKIETKNLLPKSRGPQDMLGKTLSLDGLRWLNTVNGLTAKINGKVTLLRWWTNTCKFCATSLPPIDKLDKEFKDSDFQTIAVYHPKPVRPVSGEKILEDALTYGFHGIVASDDNWSVLKHNYLDQSYGGYTSVSFLLDRNGVVRFFHPGPELRDEQIPGFEKAASDYRDLKLAIQNLLDE